ncbi:MAG TPA: phage major capsid protein [Nocardioidaceae bacterium]|nr:phage major capsid protein [Nocardioidaceae bacterium]
MSEVVKRLLERRANLVENMREVAEKAVNENRDMTAEEDRQFTETNAEVDALQKRADAMLEGEKRAKEIEDSFSALNGKPQERGTQQTDAERNKLNDWMRGQGEQRNQRAYVVPPGPLTKAETRDLTTSSSGVIDTGFRAQLWEYMVENAGVLDTGVDLLQTASGETIKLPRVTAHSAVDTTITEGAAIDEADPTLSSVNSTVAKMGYVVQLSTELIDDSGVDLQGYLARSAGRSLGIAVGAAAVTAAATGASAGATTATGEHDNLGAQNTAGKGFDYLITLFHSVIAPYRASSSCAWLMSDVTAAMVRKLKSSEGVYAWQPSVIVGQPDTILGKPVYIDTNVADPAAAAESILFGDWRSLVVRIAGGFRFERSDDFAFNADLVTFRALVRTGSVSVDANAIKSLTHGAAS